MLKPPKSSGKRVTAPRLVESLIHVIRGQKVMLDRDLADLTNCRLRDGDTVIAWKLDRLTRSTRDLLEISDTVAQAGAGLKSLSEPWADTTTPAGRMVLTVFVRLAEFERELIRERTGAGRIAAMKRGVRFGRPAKLDSLERSY